MSSLDLAFARLSYLLASGRDPGDRGRTNAPQLGRKGERHPMAKLSDMQALALRKQHENGGFTLKALGLQYGISTQQAWRICSGTSRKSLEKTA